MCFLSKEKEHEQADKEEVDLPINSDMFFDVFPFHLVFTRGMIIKNIGSGLSAIMPNILGQTVDEMFMLSRPLVEFTMENVSTSAASALLSHTRLILSSSLRRQAGNVENTPKTLFTTHKILWLEQNSSAKQLLSRELLLVPVLREIACFFGV